MRIFLLLVFVFAFLQNSQVQSKSKNKKTAIPYMCPNGEGLHPNPNSKKCYRFFSCLIKGQRADYLSCPEGYNFDSLDRICRPIGVARCDILHCSIHGELGVDVLDPESYFICEHGFARRQKCLPPGTFFDHIQGICDRPIKLVSHHHDQKNNSSQETNNSLNQMNNQYPESSPKSNPKKPNSYINYSLNKISQKDKFNLFPANKKVSSYHKYTVHDKDNVESEEKRLRHALGEIRKNLTRLFKNDSRFKDDIKDDEDFKFIEQNNFSNKIIYYIIIALSIIVSCALIGFFYFMSKNYIGPKFKCDHPPSLSTSRVEPRILYANGLGQQQQQQGQSNSNNHSQIHSTGANRQDQNVRNNRLQTVSNTVWYSSNPEHGVDPVAKIM